MFRVAGLYMKQAMMMCLRLFSNSSIHCEQYTLLTGILLLEECILLDDGDTEARTSKRARTDRPPVGTSISRWIELARLLMSI